MHAIESWISLCTTYTRGRYVLVTVSLRDPLATASSRARALHVFVHFHVRTFFFLISGPRARRSRAPAIGSRSGARPGRARNPLARLKIN